MQHMPSPVKCKVRAQLDGQGIANGSIRCKEAQKTLGPFAPLRGLFRTGFQAEGVRAHGPIPVSLIMAPAC